MAADSTPVGLGDIVLVDAIGGPPVHLGASPARLLVTVIRHRH